MKAESKTDAIMTFVGQESTIEGSISFDGTIRIDGGITGKVISKEGVVIIGEKALIKADIDVGTAIIKGNVQGTVKASNRIELYPPGSVEGDIQSPVISIEAGVKLNGNCISSIPRFQPKPDRHGNQKSPLQWALRSIKDFRLC